MSKQTICDLCKKPITFDQVEKARHFRIKERKFPFFSFDEWTEIDAHDECVRTLMAASVAGVYDRDKEGKAE